MWLRYKHYLIDMLIKKNSFHKIAFIDGETLDTVKLILEGLQKPSLTVSC